MIVISGICAKTIQAAALLNVQSCDQTTTIFFVLLFLGIAFLIIGTVVLHKGNQKEESDRDVERLLRSSDEASNQRISRTQALPSEYSSVIVTSNEVWIPILWLFGIIIAPFIGVIILPPILGIFLGVIVLVCATIYVYKNSEKHGVKGDRTFLTLIFAIIGLPLYANDLHKLRQKQQSGEFAQTKPKPIPTKQTGLRGSFSLDAETIDDQVTEVSPGVYALGLKKGNIFHVHFVGRSDVDINAELKKHVGKYDRFKFEYYDSPEAAFLKECDLYHAFRGPEGKLDNKTHPDREQGTAGACPKCASVNSSSIG